MNNYPFEKRTVIVAGGSGGLGRAVSLAFLEAGASVFVPYRRQQEFESLVQSAGENSSRLSGGVIDLTDEKATHAMAASVARQYGSLDVLVNCVGGYNAGTTVWETSTQVLEQMLSLNLRAGFTLFRATIPMMLEKDRGAIVNVVAKAAVDHAARAGAYAASKAAALALTDCLAAELKDSRIRVNSILPSIIDTEANRKAMPKADFAKWPKPEDIAKVIVYLCSDDASTIHGAAIPV